MKKFLLVALTTTRKVEGEDKKVRFPAKSVQDLTKAEIQMLDKLEESTGKPHYREPKNEVLDDDDDDGAGEDQFLGEGVAIGKKNVDQLKAYLTFHEVEFADDASKADLVKLAQAKADELDPDAGL